MLTKEQQVDAWKVLRREAGGGREQGDQFLGRQVFCARADARFHNPILDPSPLLEVGSKVTPCHRRLVCNLCLGQKSIVSRSMPCRLELLKEVDEEGAQG